MQPSVLRGPAWTASAVHARRLHTALYALDRLVGRLRVDGARRLRPQATLVDFARGNTRQLLLADPNVLGHFEFRQPLADMALELVDLERLPLLYHYRRRKALAKALVRDAEHSDFHHRRMIPDHRFDLLAGDILAAADHHVLRSEERRVGNEC